MARGYNTTRYQYETSPRKLQPQYTPVKKKYPKKSTAKKQIINARQQKKTTVNTKTVLHVGIAFAILFTISYRNTLITEEYSHIKDLKQDLALIEKQNEQLKVNIEGATNLGTVEKKATENLGMKKISEDQTIYVDTKKQDYIEASKNEIKIENKNFFKKLLDKVFKIF